MKLVLLRTSSGEESTLGQLYIDGRPECFTLEDQYQAEKVRGQTRIPDGNYEIKLREVVSPMTTKYRDKYHWFTYHLWLQNVPNFKFVYIHVGNDHEDSEACILTGNSLVNNMAQVGKITDGFLGNSAQAFERLYKPIHHKLKNTKEKVHIEIRTYIP